MCVCVVVWFCSDSLGSLHERREVREGVQRLCAGSSQSHGHANRVKPIKPSRVRAALVGQRPQQGRQAATAGSALRTGCRAAWLALRQIMCGALQRRRLRVLAFRPRHTAREGWWSVATHHDRSAWSTAASPGRRRPMTRKYAREKVPVGSRVLETQTTKQNTRAPLHLLQTAGPLNQTHTARDAVSKDWRERAWGGRSRLKRRRSSTHIQLQ